MNVPRLHAVTNDEVLALPDFRERAVALAPVRGVAVHLRGREISARDIVGLCRDLQTAGLTVYVNDRADVAVSMGAAGLHLPASGIPTNTARRLAGETIVVGRSTHSVEEAQRELNGGADYVFLGPVWPTDSHPGKPPLGPWNPAKVEGRVLGIGGIDAKRSRFCAEQGIYGVAAISAIWHSQDPSRAAREMLLSFSQND